MLFDLKKEDGLKKYLESLDSKFSDEHLDVRDFLGDGIYLLKNGDLGAIYKFSGICDETLTHKELERKIAALNKSLRAIAVGVPAFDKKSNSVIQILLRQRAVKESDFFDGCHNTLKDPILKKILIEEEKYHLKVQTILKREIFLCIRFVIKDCDKISKVELLRQFVQREMSLDDCEVSIQALLKTFKTELNNIKYALAQDFEITPVAPKEYISFIQNYFNFSKEIPVVDASSNIEQQIILPEISCSNDEIKSDNGNIKVFTIDQLPEVYLYGQFRVFLDQIPLNDFDLAWNISEGKGSLGSDLKVKEAWFSKKLSKQKEAAELVHFRQNIRSDRPYVVQSIRLMTYNLDNDQEGELRNQVMDYMDARLVKETQIPVHMLVSSMPLNCLPIQNKIKGGRYRKIRLDNALSFSPIYVGSFKNDGARNWISRQKSPTRFDLFCGQGNRMTAILAATRSGKSVFNANLILEFLAKNPTGIVRVIDKKSSYQKLGDLVGGRVINFSEAALKQNPYSPFALNGWDEDDIENIYLLISTAIVQKNIGVRLSACHTEVLRESIKFAFNAHLKNGQNAKEQNLEIDPHPIWSDILSQMPQVCENLRSSGVVGVDQARDDLAAWSVNLYHTGQYGFLFSRHELKKDENSTDRFLTYDLDGIADPILRQLASMMAFIKIGRDLAKLPRSVPKLIIFEELGMLVHGRDQAQELMDEFIHMVIKTCAKLNAQAISITNDVKDYTEKAAGRTVWDNSSQKIFLPLGDLIDSAKKAWGDKYNEADIQILESLEKEFHLKRSQAYIISKNEEAPYKGSIIIPLSPFMDALCTTSGPQVELYEDFREKGMSCMDSLIKMAEKHPFGGQIS